ncbi:MAG TPA: PilZ domain-containing protein [Acidimicrobiales bacterium]|jgi:hypothetical protein|nr:PilZ domain-containing protein [Acidimicrobiales bacterium]
MEQKRTADGSSSHALAEDRRARSRKLVSGTKLVWSRQRGRISRKLKGHNVTVFDLSSEGARVVGPTDPSVQVGTLVEVVIEGFKGLVEVRWIEAVENDPEHATYGLRFVANGEDLQAAIQRRLDEEQSAFEWMWEHIAG